MEEKEKNREVEEIINNLHYSLLRERNKLLFLGEVFNGEMNFLDNTDEEKNGDILCGLGNILEDMAVKVYGVVNELEQLGFKTVHLTNGRG